MFRAACVWIAACLAQTPPLLADELQFMPDKSSHFVSIDMATLLKSKAYADLLKEIPQIKDKFGKEMEQELGVSAAQIERISMAGAVTEIGEEFIGMVRTVGPIKWEEIKTNRMKGRRYRVNVHFEEVKIGSHTAYQEKYQFQFSPDEKPGQIQNGDILCVVGDRLVLYSRPPAMTKILNRKGAPEIGAMKKALDAVSLQSTGVILFNLDGLSDNARKHMQRDFQAIPGANDLLSNVEQLAIEGKLKEKLDVTATAICKDEATAAGVKKSADAMQTGLKGILDLLQNDMRTPMEARTLAKEGAVLLGAVKTSAKNKHAIAEVSADPAVLTRMIIMAVTLESRPRNTPPEPKVEEKKP